MLRLQSCWKFWQTLVQSIVEKSPAEVQIKLRLISHKGKEAVDTGRGWPTSRYYKQPTWKPEPSSELPPTSEVVMGYQFLDG